MMSAIMPDEVKALLRLADIDPADVTACTIECDLFEKPRINVTRRTPLGKVEEEFKVETK